LWSMHNKQNGYPFLNKQNVTRTAGLVNFLLQTCTLND